MFAREKMKMGNLKNPLKIDGLLSFWNFQGSDREFLRAGGPGEYEIEVMDGDIRRSQEGAFGPNGLLLQDKVWYRVPRKECPLLNRCGDNSELTVVAWIKRYRQERETCEAIAGMWDETRKKRQYCLFLNINITGGRNSVSGHVSSVGGATPGCKYCEDVSVGATPVPYDKWQTVAFTYDCKFAKSYLNGKLDEFGKKNPYPYEGKLFDGGFDGSDFTVGAVNRSGEMGNWFRGILGGLAVYDKALSEKELERISYWA